MSTAILEMPTLTPTRNAAAPAGLDRIVLTGFMGSGKSTVGALLAERLGWKFFDLDAEIERREGMSVPAIFANMGEMRFRRAEAAALAASVSHEMAASGSRSMVMRSGRSRSSLRDLQGCTSMTPIWASSASAIGVESVMYGSGLPVFLSGTITDSMPIGRVPVACF